MNKIDLPEIDFKTGDDAASSFREVVKTHGDQTALIFKERRISWSELGLQVNSAANALIDLSARSHTVSG